MRSDFAASGSTSAWVASARRLQRCDDDDAATAAAGLAATSECGAGAAQRDARTRLRSIGRRGEEEQWTNRFAAPCDPVCTRSAAACDTLLCCLCTVAAQSAMTTHYTAHRCSRRISTRDVTVTDARSTADPIVARMVDATKRARPRSRLALVSYTATPCDCIGCHRFVAGACFLLLRLGAERALESQRR